jgi:hypothetical protein
MTSSEMNEMSSHASPPVSAERAPRDATRAHGISRQATGARPLIRSPYPSIVGRVLQRAASLQVIEWDRALRFLERTQSETLMALLDHAKGTWFGRVHGFRGIGSYADFVDRVPVGDYDSHSPFIDRMRRGERGLLVPEFVKYYGNSSGSSNHGKSKFLPITDRQIRFQQRAGTDVVMRYLNWSGDEGLFGGGFTLGLFPPTTMKKDGPVFVTSNPALMMTKMPAVTRPCYLPEEDVRVIANYDEKLNVIAERYLDHDVRAITGTTCWFTILFEKVLAAAKRRGMGVRTVSDVWPNLSVLFGGGVSATPYLPVIRELLGRDDVTLIDTYNATEGGVYGASDFSGARGLLMLPHRGTFFEFVPVEQRQSKKAERVPLWAVERDRAYSIVVTTASGLYAYELGDIVRFTTIAPLRIEFMGRLSGCLSVTQELTTHVEIERAVEEAVAEVSGAEVHCRTLDFGAAADVGVDGTAKSRYVLFVEFQDGAAPGDMTTFAAAFDRGMSKQNRVYREHRAGEVGILPPKVVELRPGGARAFLSEVTRGNVQGKFPRIIDDTKKKLLWKHAKGSP